MKIIGLTGGSGTGKGTVAARMRALGAGWVDADAVYRTLCAENREMLSALDTAFGIVTDANGALDRPKLAKIVFSDPTKLQTLNEITTPYIRRASLDAIHAQSECPIVLYDAPTCLKPVRMTSATKSSLCSRRTTRALPASSSGTVCPMKPHAPASMRSRTTCFTAKKCDFIIENNGDLDMLYRDTDALYSQLIK